MLGKNIVFLSRCDQQNDFHSDKNLYVQDIPLVPFTSYTYQHRYPSRDVSENLMLVHQMFINELDNDLYMEQGIHNLNVADYIDSVQKNPTEEKIDVMLSDMKVLKQAKYIKFSDAAKRVYFMLRCARIGDLQDIKYDEGVYNALCNVIVNNRMEGINEYVIQMVAHIMQYYVFPKIPEYDQHSEAGMVYDVEEMVIGLMNAFNMLYYTQETADERFYHLVYGTLFAVDIALYSKYKYKLFIREINTAMTNDIKAALSKMISCVQSKHKTASEIKNKIKNVKDLFRHSVNDAYNLKQNKLMQMLGIIKMFLLGLGCLVSIIVLHIFLLLSNGFHYIYYYYIIKLRYRRALRLFVA